MRQLDASGKLLSWASELDEKTTEQALMASRLPIVTTHVALMPDAHLGIGATVGSVIPTKGAVIPSAVGVDIGCGMIAVLTDLVASDLPSHTDRLVQGFVKSVPAGLGKWHVDPSDAALAWWAKNPPPTLMPDDEVRKAQSQMGTLGSGNHFLEVCLDEADRVWVVLHSGSRGIGNKLAQRHIQLAKDSWTGNPLEDPDLSYFVEQQPKFHDYINDMLWAQGYALANREIMMNAALTTFFQWCGRGARGQELQRINCHHNFCQREQHLGEDFWVTRKGAIKADVGDWGVIPGSMGTKSYIVQGKGNPQSFNSCSHGAGRRHSRNQARKLFTVEDMKREMADVTSWQDASAKDLLDEIPSAYKDIDQVMADQSDLVEIRHTLRQIVNMKGVDSRKGHR